MLGDEQAVRWRAELVPPYFLRIVHRSVGAPEDGRRRLGGSLLRRGDRW